MRISLFTSWKTRCGIADYSRLLKNALEGHGCAATVVPVEEAKTRATLKRLGKMMNAADVAHIQHEFSFFASNIPTRTFIYRALINSGLFLWQIKIPKVVTLHETVPEIPGLGLERFLMNFVQRFVFSLADVITVHIESQRKAIVGIGVNKDKVIVVPHPIPEVAPLQDTRANYKKRLGVEGKMVLTIFGFVNWRKGHDLVIDALKGLNDCVFFIAGGAHPNDKSSYFDGLVRQIKEMHLEHSVKIFGYLPASEICTIMGATDIVLAPFRDMTGSGSLSTGIAHHKPIIGSDLEPMKELKAHGLGIELFMAEDSEDLRDKILSLVNDAGRLAQLEGLTKTYAEEYSYGKIALRLKGLYEDLVEQARAGRRKGAFKER